MTNVHEGDDHEMHVYLEIVRADGTHSEVLLAEFTAVNEEE